MLPFPSVIIYVDAIYILVVLCGWMVGDMSSVVGKQEQILRKLSGLKAQKNPTKQNPPQYPALFFFYPLDTFFAVSFDSALWKMHYFCVLNRCQKHYIATNNCFLTMLKQHISPERVFSKKSPTNMLFWSTDVRNCWTSSPCYYITQTYTLENWDGFSHITVKLCGRKCKVEKSSTDPMALIAISFAILLAFLLV